MCVATDVAARGIDLPNLDLVIHADIPKGKESLLHRSGRTGRAGRKGVSALMVPHNWRKRTERLLQNAKVEAEWTKPPSADEIAKRDRERILEDANLSAELSAEDQAFAAEILERHGAERVAIAFLNLHRANQPAAEELIDAGPSDRPDARERKPRNDFENGVWFSLSVGRKHNAEPRWLLPMLCRAGHITKREIGSIKIHQTETHVEIEAGSVDKFLEAIGPSRKVEKSVTVDRLDGVPAAPARSSGRNFDKRDDKPRRDKPYGKKKSYGDDKPRDKKPWADKPRADKPRDDKPREKKSWDDKPRADKPHSDKPHTDKPHADKPRDVKAREGENIVDKFIGDKPPRSDKPRSDKPRRDKPEGAGWAKSNKSKGKKTFKPKKGQKSGGSFEPKYKPKSGAKTGTKSGSKFAKGAGKKFGPAKPGSAPLKRKKLKLKPN